MFEILQKWLISKLGINNCSNLNYSNIGEKFKDGVLLAHLLKKYQVIPDCYANVLKKTNFYAACLSNIKTLNTWLQFLDIIIEDYAICEIACGQSLAVVKLLYQLYFKFEMLKQHQILNNDYVNESGQLNNNSVLNINCKQRYGYKNILPSQEMRKHKEKLLILNYETFSVLDLLHSSEGILYSAIDVLKLTKSVNANEGNTLDFIQHNMHWFNDLFIKNLYTQLLENEITEKSYSNEICRSYIFDILNKTKKDNEKMDKLKYNDRTNRINNLNSKTNTHNNNHSATELDNKHQIIQDINHVSDPLICVSQEDSRNENSSIRTVDEEGSTITKSSNENEQINIGKRNVFNEYVQHIGLWSSEYLNVKSHQCKQNILSMIVKEVLNFEYDTNEIKPIKIEKTTVAGVIDGLHNTKVIQLIKDNLENHGILSFTPDDAVSACLEAYKEEKKISQNKGRLYEVLSDYENQYSNDQLMEINSDVVQLDNNSINSMPSVSNPVSIISTESIGESINVVNGNTKNTNKLIQTPEIIPEPDYNNPYLSTMANLGKIIHEKHMKNHDLQIGDQINCIGEYIKQNQKNNGWIILEYPIQPLQMALLEYKFNGTLPPFGKEICKSTKKNSSIVPEYQDYENTPNSTNSYFSHCVKIIKHKDEINNGNWYDLLQFYKQEDSMQVLMKHSNSFTKQPRKAADILVALILDEENEFENEQIFQMVNIYIDFGEGESTENDNEEKQVSESIILTDDKTGTMKSNQIITCFQLLNTNFSWNEGNLTNNTYTALYLCDIWETMEQNYIHKVKELLNSKETLFEEIKLSIDLNMKTVDQKIEFNNSHVMNLIHKYENENKLKNKLFENHILEFQFNMWDEVDNELEQLTQFIKHTISDQWIDNKCNILINIYKKLLEIELKRTNTTLKFLNGYYDDINKFEIKEFDFCTIINDYNDTDNFQTLCLDTIIKFKKYIYENYEEIKRTNQEAWTECVLTEKNRFINQVYRIKASMVLDRTYIYNLTRIDQFLEKVYRIHQFKIEDINKLCKILESVADSGININDHIKQISGKFYINELSVSELYFKQIFNSRENFSMKQLKTIINELLHTAPEFQMSLKNLIDTLNELRKLHHIYPKNWPTEDQFYNYFPKEILGNNLTTIDWRDFVVQCMELPYPNMEQLLFYRKLFQTYDTGDETITIDNYKTTKLWFENESIRYNEAKWLLYDMYKIQNRLNYSVMLLAFCRDEQPWIGLIKSIGLSFGCNPFDLKMLNVNQFNYHNNGSEIDTEDKISDNHLSDLNNDKCIIDQNTMTLILTTNLKLYLDNEKLLGNIDISQTVDLIYAHIHSKQENITVFNLFQNNIMDDLYNTVYKFQSKELIEVAENIFIKYNITYI